MVAGALSCLRPSTLAHLCLVPSVWEPKFCPSAPSSERTRAPAARHPWGPLGTAFRAAQNRRGLVAIGLHPPGRIMCLSQQGWSSPSQSCRLSRNLGTCEKDAGTWVIQGCRAWSSTHHSTNPPATHRPHKHPTKLGHPSMAAPAICWPALIHRSSLLFSQPPSRLLTHVPLPATHISYPGTCLSAHVTCAGIGPPVAVSTHLPRPTHHPPIHSSCIPLLHPVPQPWSR